MAEEGNKLAKSALRSSYLSSIISISLVLFLTGILVVLVLAGKKISDHFKENYQVTLILKPNVTEEEGKLIAGEIANDSKIRSTALITKDEAAKKLSEELGEDFVTFLGNNPLSHSIDVTFKAGFAENTIIESFVKSYSANSKVEEVRYEPMLMDTINKNIRKISLLVLGFGGLLFFIMVVLINNTIRISLYAKRLLIKSMQLVGATRGFIRKPFLIKGLLSGFYGAVAANILLAGLLYFAQKEMPELGVLQDFKMLGILMATVLVLGIIISGASTFFAVNKYLHKSFDELF